jgi:uncharacterized protein (TIGR02246 family)
MHIVLKCSTYLLVAGTLLAQAPLSTGSDEATIRQLVQKYVDARELEDGNAIGALFTTDADQLVSSGEWRKGRDEIVRGTLASSQKEGGNRTISVEEVRFISPDVAVADGRYELTGLVGGQTRKMWTTLICKRDASGWRIAAIRNMLPAPARR